MIKQLVVNGFTVKMVDRSDGYPSLSVAISHPNKPGVENVVDCELMYKALRSSKLSIEQKFEVQKSFNELIMKATDDLMI